MPNGIDDNLVCIALALIAMHELIVHPHTATDITTLTHDDYARIHSGATVYFNQFTFKH